MEHQHQLHSKESMLKEFKFLIKHKKILLRSINSNRITINSQFKVMFNLIDKGLQNIEDLIELDICLGKINTYIAMAFLNSMEDHTLELKYITRLPALLFKMHLNKLKILKVLRITGLYNQLVNLPSEISYLCNLVELDLNHCALLDLPKEIGQLKHLEKLNLNDNFFTALPEEIGDLKALKELHICNNPNLSSLPEEIGDLLALEILNMHHDGLETLPRSIGQLNSLKEINLDFNKLIIVPPEFSQLSHLERIHLRHNRLKKLSLVLTNLKNLQTIDIGENDIDELPEEFGTYLH